MTKSDAFRSSFSSYPQFEDQMLRERENLHWCALSVSGFPSPPLGAIFLQVDLGFCSLHHLSLARSTISLPSSRSLRNYKPQNLHKAADIMLFGLYERRERGHPKVTHCFCPRVCVFWGIERMDRGKALIDFVFLRYSWAINFDWFHL